MAQLSEWFKGISFGIFAIIMYYFYWDNIFLGILNFIGNFSISGVTGSSSISILKTFSWISFSILFIMTVPLYIYYAILTGSKNEGKTHPIEILKGNALWAILAPIGLVVYVIVASLVNALSGFDVGSGTATASNFSWLIGLIVIIGINFLPFYYVLKGYGQFGGNNE